MKLTNLAFSVMAALALPGVSSAATPDQVGTWIGTVKEVTLSSGTKTTVKSDLQIQIAADNLTTITVNGAALLSSGNFYNATDGGGVFLDPSVVLPLTAVGVITFNFKKTTLKGGWSEVISTPLPVPALSAIAEAKFKLKKQ